MTYLRLCTDAELIRNVYGRYDSAQSEAGGSKVFTSLVTALKRLITEKPALLGVCQQMFGVGVTSTSGLASDASGAGALVSSTSNVTSGVAGMVAASVSGVVGMMGAGAGLSLQGSAMKLQWYVNDISNLDIDVHVIVNIALTNWIRLIRPRFRNRISTSLESSASFHSAKGLPPLLDRYTVRL